jgi:hypothetical protein
MGLDMYLHTRRFDHSGSRFDPESDKRPEHNGWKQQTIEYDVHYWRKFAPLHHYIVKHFAYQGEDNCQPIELGVDACEQIAQALRHPDTSFDLDECGGFFFGNREMWEDDLKVCANESAETFEKVAKWLREEEEGFWRSCYYQASW